jgi:hypothetical protein
MRNEETDMGTGKGAAMTEHEAKYDALARLLGLDALRRLVPVPAERISAALAAGDEHLNSIPLGMWDRAALSAPGAEDAGRTRVCPSCKQTVRPVSELYSADWPQRPLRRTARFTPWNAAPTLSLAERVCALKHVAKFHLSAGATPHGGKSQVN